MSSLVKLVVLSTLIVMASGLRCWQCGQYSDGVGSITPCNNRSATKLDMCPPNAKYCILVVILLSPGVQDLLYDPDDDLTASFATLQPNTINIPSCGLTVGYPFGTVKYVSELTVVRDCVPTCSEKEWWGARTFCCETDECNGAFTRTPFAAFIASLIIAALFVR